MDVKRGSKGDKTVRPECAKFQGPMEPGLEMIAESEHVDVSLEIQTYK